MPPLKARRTSTGKNLLVHISQLLGIRLFRGKLIFNFTLQITQNPATIICNGDCYITITTSLIVRQHGRAFILP